MIGQFSNTEQVLIGDLDAQKTLQTGGVYRAPMLWRVNVIEVNRMAALAIRRRNEILGPLAVQDSINKQLSAALSAGNLAPANHWSHAWIDLLRGLAQAGAGKLDLFADYFQLYIQDEKVAGNLSDSWTQESVDMLLATTE